MIEYLDGVREIVNYESNFKVRVFLNDEYEDYPHHWHPDAEIIMPLENGYTVKVDGQRYTLKDNDILVIPPGELHELYAPEAGKRIIVQFDGTLLHDFEGFASAFHMYHPCVKITRDEDESLHDRLMTLMTNIADEYFSNKPFREAAAYADLIQFFTMLGRNHLGNNKNLSHVECKKQHQYVDLMFKICHHIDQHCTEPMDIDDLADMAGFSKFHFHRVFKQVMNVSCY